MSPPLFFISIFIILSGFINPTSAEPEDIVRPAIEYKAEELRDPFEEYAIETKEKTEEKVEVTPAIIEEEIILPPPALNIQGIVWGGELAQAIINNKVVKVGDVIEEAELIDIQREGIVISFKNRQYNLSSPAAAYLTEEAKGGKNEEY